MTLHFRLLFAALLIVPPLLPAQQTSESFTEAGFPSQVLNYHPAQREGVPPAAYARATNILEQTRSATKGDPANLNVSDYWNITTAFVMVHEPSENIRLAFSKAIAIDPATICSYVKAMGPSQLDMLIPETFLPFYTRCLEKQSASKGFDAAQFAAKNHLDLALVTQIQQIESKDRQFRNREPFDNAKQHPLDVENQQAIEALYAKYQTYIGRSMVGKEFESVMWSVIQHSDLAMMERFMPVLQKAVAQKELGSGPFKMLIDRIYSVRNHQQIFGSQANFPMADAKTREAVKQQYGLE